MRADSPAPAIDHLLKGVVGDGRIPRQPVFEDLQSARHVGDQAFRIAVAEGEEGAGFGGLLAIDTLPVEPDDDQNADHRQKNGDHQQGLERGPPQKAGQRSRASAGRVDRLAGSPDILAGAVHGRYPLPQIAGGA